MDYQLGPGPLQAEIQHGTTSYSGLKQGGYSGRITVTIRLSHAMPNTDYFAHAELDGAYPDFPMIVCYVFSKTTTSFDVTLVNSATGSAETNGRLRWLAIA